MILPFSNYPLTVLISVTTIRIPHNLLFVIYIFIGTVCTTSNYIITTIVTVNVTIVMTMLWIIVQYYTTKVTIQLLCG